MPDYKYFVISVEIYAEYAIENRLLKVCKRLCNIIHRLIIKIIVKRLYNKRTLVSIIFSKISKK